LARVRIGAVRLVRSGRRLVPENLVIFLFLSGLLLVLLGVVSVVVRSGDWVDELVCRFERPARRLFAKEVSPSGASDREG